MIKKYSFLQEFLATTGMVLAPALLGLGAYSTYKGYNQGKVNTSVMSRMYSELVKCPPNDRQMALNIVNKYTNTQQSTNTFAKDKDVQKRTIIAQSIINQTFRTPLLHIIQNSPDWKNDALTYFAKNARHMDKKQKIGTAISTLGLATGAAGTATMMTGAAMNPLISTAGLSLFALNTIQTQLKYFKSKIYINRMINELNATNDRQECIDIINKYCYQITNDLQNIINKSGKKIPLDVQNEMRVKFATPLIQICNNTSNAYWKTVLIDNINSQKIQDNIQYVADLIGRLIIPKFMSKFINTSQK